MYYLLFSIFDQNFKPLTQGVLDCVHLLSTKTTGLRLGNRHQFDPVQTTQPMALPHPRTTSTYALTIMRNTLIR